MSFTDFSFYGVVVVILLLHGAVKSLGAKHLLLWGASLGLYASLEPVFAWALLFLSLFNFFLARGMGGEVPNRRNFWMGTLTNLGILFLFKYLAFFRENAQVLIDWSGWELPEYSLWLPVGISFFTFQIQSYLLDVHYRVLKPEKSLIRFGLYVSFFPQLVAGPIVKARHFLPQLETSRRPDGVEILKALQEISGGLVLKVVVADNLAHYTLALADPTYSVRHAINLVVLSWSFMVQVFGDFAGYSLIAIGLARLLGFELPTNFRAPFLATGFNDFWKRWHITLTSWFRDYIFLRMSMRGWFKGKLYTSLLITFLISGLWHGPYWSYILWGLLHGVGCAVDTLLQSKMGRKRRPVWFRALGWCVTFQLVCFLGVFFYHTNLGSATGYFSSFMGPAWKEPLLLARIGDMLFFLGLVLVHHLWVAFGEWKPTLKTRQESVPLRSLVIGVNLVLLCTLWGEGRQFIYFQF